MPFSPPPVCVALALSLLLGACAQVGAQIGAVTSVDDTLPGCRVQLRTRADWPEPTALAERAAAVAGLAKAQVAAIGPRWFALSLPAAAATCPQIIERLRADPDLAVEVFTDSPRRLPERPSRAQAR